MNNNFNNQPSDYPDVFFTKSKKNEPTTNNFTTCSHCGKVFSNNQQNTPSPTNIQLPFNMDMLKNILPLLSSKGGGIDFSSILGKFNPQFSNIFSMLGINNKKGETKKKEEKPSTGSIIDISEYTEVS